MIGRPCGVSRRGVVDGRAGNTDPFEDVAHSVLGRLSASIEGLPNGFRETLVGEFVGVRIVRVDHITIRVRSEDR